MQTGVTSGAAHGGRRQTGSPLPATLREVGVMGWMWQEVGEVEVMWTEERESGMVACEEEEEVLKETAEVSWRFLIILV